MVSHERVAERAWARAQRRFHRMVVEQSYSDPTSRTARLYVEAERLIDRLRGEESGYFLTTRSLDARMDALHDATMAALEELEEAEAQDARPWNLPEIPLALYSEGDLRADWGLR